MKQILIPALLMTLVLTVLTGLVYPLVVTGLSQTLFHKQANGSLIEVNGKIIGSELIGQKFTKPGYFHGRPSAAGDGYDAANSGATNLGPTNQALINRVRDDIKKFRSENPTYTGPIPADLLTASGSGLDPHISLRNAELQAHRVAKARNIPVDKVTSLIQANTDPASLGFLGEPGVNVLMLNLALDRATNGHTARAAESHGRTPGT